MPDDLSITLDPANPQALRAQGHRMLDDLFDYLESLRTKPVWQPIPPSVRTSFNEALPAAPTDLADAHARFMQDVLPYAVGNAHPRFMGWVHGGGTAVGMLAEMVAAGLNANVGGRDQMPLEVERQVVSWMRELFRFPASANGVFVTGSSMANFIGLLCARTRVLGAASRTDGIGQAKLVAYAASTAHGCIADAMSMAGCGSAALRRVPVDANHRMDVAALTRRIAADRKAGLTPFFVVGTAGSVDVGAVDNLEWVANVAAREGLWFHVDGALGALGMLAPDVAPLLAGIERADSIALDFHKWGQVPYDAGFVLVRDGADQLATFASPTSYLARHPRGLAAGQAWPCDLGPDLSRSFRALKTWFTLVVHGTDRIGAAISHSCALARHLAHRVDTSAKLELLAPVGLNVVCFRHAGDASLQSADDIDAFNAEIAADLQESGIAAPSTTVLGGRVAIRAAIVNHRTVASDVDALIDATLRFAARRLQALSATVSQLAALDALAAAERADETRVTPLASVAAAAAPGRPTAPPRAAAPPPLRR